MAAGYDGPCVLPTSGETHFEAFQAIIATLLFAHYPAKLPGDEDLSPYEILCYSSGIVRLVTSRRKPNVRDGCPVIYYHASKVTHYKALLCDGKAKDPYQLYQAKNTQGFCQLFAFFLATNDTKGFIEVDQTAPISNDNFYKLARNTYECMHKFIELLERNDDFANSFRAYFDFLVANEDDRRNFGFISADITLEDFIEDLRKFELIDVMYYIFVV